MTNARDFILTTPTRFEVFDGHEHFPVTLDGLIGRQGASEQQMSGNWRVLGMSFHPRSTSFTPWTEIRGRLIAGQSLGGYLWDSDHGTTRRWGRKIEMFVRAQESAQTVVAHLLEDASPSKTRLLNP